MFINSTEIAKNKDLNTYSIKVLSGNFKKIKYYNEE